MKAKELKLIEMCLENGLQYGWMRAHKHTDNPEMDAVISEMMFAVMSEIHEWFDQNWSDK